MSATSGMFDSQFTAENNAFWAENETNQTETTKIVIFGAENKNKISNDVDISECCFLTVIVQVRCTNAVI